MNESLEKINNFSFGKPDIKELQKELFDLTKKNKVDIISVNNRNINYMPYFSNKITNEDYKSENNNLYNKKLSYQSLVTPTLNEEKNNHIEINESPFQMENNKFKNRQSYTYENPYKLQKNQKITSFNIVSYGDQIRESKVEDEPHETISNIQEVDDMPSLINYIENYHLNKENPTFESKNSEEGVKNKIKQNKKMKPHFDKPLNDLKKINRKVKMFIFHPYGVGERKNLNSSSVQKYKLNNLNQVNRNLKEINKENSLPSIKKFSPRSSVDYLNKSFQRRVQNFRSSKQHKYLNMHKYSLNESKLSKNSSSFINPRKKPKYIIPWKSILSKLEQIT